MKLNDPEQFVISFLSGRLKKENTISLVGERSENSPLKEELDKAGYVVTEVYTAQNPMNSNTNFNSRNYRTGVLGWVAPVRVMVKPLSEGLFAGMLDFSKMPFKWDTLLFRLSVALGIFPRGDHRDWAAIQSWAKGLKTVLA